MKILINEKLSEHKYKTPEGYLVCVDSILARTGKQTYRRNELFHDGDDTEVEVDRTPEEVFSEATLASFENKPVTVEHPDEDVNVNNYKEYAVGFVRDVKRGFADGQDVILGTLVITDAQTIEEIENGEHTDLSCGYDCDILDEENPSQKNIRGNHVALCQQGRAGIAKIVDSVSDATYCVEFSENGQVFKTWIDARDEKEAQELTLHSNPKARIRNVYRDSVNDANRLLAKDRKFISNYLRMISTYTSRDVDIKDLLRPLSGHGYNWTIEKIDGWKWNHGEYAHKDYYVSINGYDDRFLVTLYADPNRDWKVKEVNAYFTDSIKDRDLTKAEEYKIAKELSSRFGQRFTTTGESGVESSIGIWPNSELDKKIVKYLKSKGYKVDWDHIGDDGCYYLTKDAIEDSVSDSTYKCEFKVNGQSMWTYVKADSPEDAKRELLDKFASAKEISITSHDSVEDRDMSIEEYLELMKQGDAERVYRNAHGNPNAEKAYRLYKGYDSITDSLCDAELVKLTNEPGRDKILAVYQSDVDENLYFYVGANYCMRDGEFTYNKYKTLGTPQQIMRELERNGWHKVNRGLAPFIDSIDDSSINDSLASDVYSELKRQFPDIQIQMKSRPHATPHAFLKCTDFYLSASNSKLESIMKFCQHLAKKYNNDKTNIYVNEYSHTLQLKEYTGIDSKTQAAISEYVKHVEEAVHAAYPKVDVKTKTEANVKGLSLTLEFLNTSSYPNCMEKIQKNISSFFATRIPNGIILKTEVDELQRLAKTPLRFKDSISDATRKELIQKLKTVSIPHEGRLTIDDKSGWSLDIQNVGGWEATGKFTPINKEAKQYYPNLSRTSYSHAWGRLWYNGKLMQQFEGPITIVKENMIKYLNSQMKDSKAKLDSAMKVVNILKTKAKAKDANIDSYIKEMCINSFVDNDLNKDMYDDAKKNPEKGDNALIIEAYKKYKSLPKWKVRFVHHTPPRDKWSTRTCRAQSENDAKNIANEYLKKYGGPNWKVYEITKA